MQLYLIRHGLAGQHGDDEDDRQRPLTSDGVRKTQQVARRLKELGLQVDLILTSPLVRAHQTADILKAAKIGQQLTIASYLAPGGAIEEWLQWLESWRSPERSLALVGHEPDLSSWAEQLVWGKVSGNLQLKKAGTIALDVPDTGDAIGTCQLLWLVPPRVLLM